MTDGSSGGSTRRTYLAEVLGGCTWRKYHPMSPKVTRPDSHSSWRKFLAEVTDGSSCGLHRPKVTLRSTLPKVRLPRRKYLAEVMDGSACGLHRPKVTPRLPNFFPPCGRSTRTRLRTPRSQQGDLVYPNPQGYTRSQFLAGFQSTHPHFRNAEGDTTSGGGSFTRYSVAKAKEKPRTASVPSLYTTSQVRSPDLT